MQSRYRRAAPLYDLYISRSELQRLLSFVSTSKSGCIESAYNRLIFAYTVLADAQVYTGFDEWDQTSKSQTTVPRGITIAFWVLFSVEIFAYIVGWVVMEPLARRQHKAFLDLHPEMKEGGGSRMNLMSENSR